ncbi:hypothetical protein [Erythrobacter crassostreae]|uniref:Uncharacterized protein n=1 Tax=Erythrobacter crassostreae TaxID=2828328 RepID=A0A9X1F5W8_9SPHN|nr:hypothetical protein [Erythrobacter crassostrea]MBV7259400.1 hypothetical protein [Erythrobacter crassostrea]
MASNVYIQDSEGAAVPSGEFEYWHWRVFVVLALWAAGVAAATLAGVFETLPMQAVAPLAALGIIAPVVLYKTVPSLGAFLRSRSLDYFTTFHLWRIGAAGLFFWYGSQNLLPETFVRHAAWGDLLAGLLVLPLLFSASKGLRKYVLFHTVGFLDFILAVGTGLYFTIIGDPAMSSIATLPLILIPLFGVSVSGASHIIAFDIMRGRSQGDAAYEQAA